LSLFPCSKNLISSVFLWWGKINRGV